MLRQVYQALDNSFAVRMMIMLCTVTWQPMSPSVLQLIYLHKATARLALARPAQSVPHRRLCQAELM